MDDEYTLRGRRISGWVTLCSLALTLSGVAAPSIFEVWLVGPFYGICLLVAAFAAMASALVYVAFTNTRTTSELFDHLLLQVAVGNASKETLAKLFKELPPEEKERQVNRLAAKWDVSPIEVLDDEPHQKGA